MNKYLIGFITFAILASSLYFILDNNYRIDIKETYTSFKVYENNSWVLGGEERTKLWDGTTLMRSNNRVVNYTMEGNTTIAYRYAYFKDGCVAVDIYEFNGSNKDVELFPVSHKIETYNCSGKILMYEVTKLGYYGETDYDIGNAHEFEHNMKVEWSDGNYYERVYKYKDSNEGKLEIKYKINSDNFSTYARLFDPIIETDSVFPKLIYNNADFDKGIAIYEFNNPVDNLSKEDLFHTYYLAQGEGIKEFKVYVEKTKIEEIPKYKTMSVSSECIKYDNLTKSNYTENCIDYFEVQDGFYKQEITYWEELNGTLTKGKYKIKIEGYWKKVGQIQSVDWFPNVKLDSKKYNLPKDMYGKADTKLLTQTKYAWWNVNWTYKREIKIQENSGSNLTNYSILINITNAQVRGDFESVRFSDSSETTSLPYWIETIGNGSGVTYENFSLAPMNGSLLNGLISYYKLDETTGTTAYDSLGTNNGTISGATVNQTGKINKAYDFDGVDDYILMDNNADLGNPFTEISISGWIYPNSAVLCGSMYNIRYSSYVTYLGYLESGLFGFSVGGDVTDRVTISTGDLTLNSWNYVVGTYNGTTMKIYVNGVLKNTRTVSATIRSSGTVNIGRDPAVSGRNFDGKIDEVGIWNRSLTSIEISEIYNASWKNYWVKVENLNASVNNTIYMYYGNENATSESNPKNTFIYYEDFSTDVFSSGWTRSDSSRVYVDTASGWLKIPNVGTNDDWAAYAPDNITNIDANGIIIEQRTKIDGAGGSGYYLGIHSMYYNGISSQTSLATFLPPSGTYGWNFYNTWNADAKGFSSADNLKWGILKTKHTSTSGTQYFKRETDSDFTEIQTRSLGLTKLSGFRYSQSWDINMAIDWIRVYKTATSEPTYYIGDEENSTIPPSITLISPENYYNFSTGSIQLETTVTDDLQVENVSLYLNGIINQTDTSQINGTYYFDLTLEDGDYNWSINACDNESNCVNSSIRYFLIDTIPPVVNITFPEDNGMYNYQFDYVNFTATDTNLEICQYSLNGGDYVIIPCDENITGITFDEGWNEFQIDANDSAGNSDQKVINFFIDSIIPNIEIDYPINNTYYNEVLWLNYTANDTNLNDCWYSLDRGATNSTKVSCEDDFQINGTEGQNNWTVYADDTIGNLNSSSVTFYIYNLTYTINNQTNNLIAELGTPLYLNVTTNLGNVSFDLLHPDYGINQNNSFLSSTLQVIISYFRNNLFSDGNEFQELQFTEINETSNESTYGIQNFSIPVHQYDYVQNLSVNISGFINNGNSSTENSQIIFYNPSNHSEILEYFYGELNGTNIIVNSLIDPTNNSNLYPKSYTISFDTTGEKRTYIPVNDNAKEINISINLSAGEYGFSYVDTYFNNSDEVYTNSTVFLRSLLPAQNNFRNEIFEPFNSSINTTYWFLTADYYVNNDQELDQLVSNTFGDNKSTLYSSLTEDLDAGESDTSTINNYLYISNSTYFNLWSNKETVINLSYTLFGEDENSFDDTTGYIELLAGGVVVWKSLTIEELNDEQTTASSNSLIFNITRDEENDRLYFNITGVEQIGPLDAGSCDNLYVTRNWTNNSLKLDYSSPSCSDIIGYQPYPFLDGGFGDLDDQLKFHTYLRGHAEREEETYSCTGSGIICLDADCSLSEPFCDGDGVATYGGNTYYCSTQYTEEMCTGETGIMKLIELGYGSGSCDWYSGSGSSTPCYGAGTEALCESPTYGYYSGSCTWELGSTITGTHQAYATLNVYPINRTIGDILDSSYYSNSIFNSALNVNSVWAYIFGKGGASIQISTDNGEHWTEAYPNGVETPIIYPGKNVKYKISFFNDTGTSYNIPIITNVNFSTEQDNPHDVFIDIGGDGIYDYNFSGELNNSYNFSLNNINVSGLITSSTGNISSYLPIVVNSSTAGFINFTNVETIYFPNKIEINVTKIKEYFKTLNNFSNLNISIGAINGTINLTDLRYDYSGGNKTYEILAHSQDYIMNRTINITYYFTQWDYEWKPLEVEWIYFPPKTPTSKSVMPYGQTNSTPIINLTNLGYGGRNATVYVNVSETLPCVNTTLSFSSNKSQGFVLESNNWTQIANMSYLETKNVWLFADYSCNYSNYYLFNPDLSFSFCVEGGLCEQKTI